MKPHAGVATLRDLARISLVTNTPKFLFDRFRAHSFVAAVNASNSSAELLEQIQRFGTKHSLNIRDQLLCYVIICAVSLRPLCEEEEQILAAFEHLPLRWARPLADMARATAPSYSYASLDAKWNPQTSRQDYRTYAGSGATATIADIKPTLVIK